MTMFNSTEAEATLSLSEVAARIAQARDLERVSRDAEWVKRTTEALSTARESGVLDTDEAHDLWESITGRDFGNPFVATWKVQVFLGQDVLLEVGEIEGQDEDEACQQVQDNIEVRDLTVTCRIRYEYQESEEFDADDLVEVDESSLVEALAYKATRE